MSETFTPTPELEQEVLDSFERTHSPFKVAKQLGVDLDYVFATLRLGKDRVSVQQEKFGGLGRPEMQQYSMARRKVLVLGWDNDDAGVATARRRLQDGTHTMATGRDGSWLILYSIPLKRPVAPRPDFFVPEVA